MAPGPRSRKRGTGRSASGSRRAGRGRWTPLRVLAFAVLAAGFALGFESARTVVQLDRVVRARFEGRLFRIPSQVLSAPTILYPGLDWRRIDLQGTLLRLGYRPDADPGPLPVGRFAWTGSRLRLHRRAFQHPTRSEPDRDVLILLDGDQISEIRDASSGRELGAFFLDPELVGAYYGPDHEQRELVKLDQVPPALIDAVLAVEDQRFMSHPGIDLHRILGAMVANLRAGAITQGGSTLTQQLVKNFFLTPERSFRRKAQEAVMALLVEAHYDKEKILEAYLNEIYLGQRGSTAIHGVGEAAHFYFGKSIQHLSLAECALLAGLIQSPNGLSPYRNPKGAIRRRDLVLHLMKDQGRIDEAELDAALGAPLQLAKVTPEPRDARYFLDALRQQLPDFYDNDVLTTEGLKIYSTLDLRLQRAASRAVDETLADLERRDPALAPKDGQRLQACLVVLRPQTGEVLALVGGRDYSESQYDRCTQAHRPAGSAFKPFVYAAALEPQNGKPVITLASRLDDQPLEVSTPSGMWRPRNFDRQFHGIVSVREAIEDSYNVATSRLAQQVGIDRIIAMAHRLGIESSLQDVPSLAIGTADVTPLEMARAYATLANGGIRPRIRTFEDVVDPRGGTVERQPIRFERVLDPGTAFLTTTLLEGVVDRGTARAIRAAGIVGPVAGKTGTSDDERDAWFAGYTPELVAIAWVGFDTPRSLGHASTQIAVPLWIRFMKEATGGTIRGAFLPPSDVIEADVDPETGALALAGCPDRTEEYFLRGTEPTQTCPSWGGSRDAGTGQRSLPGWLEDVFRGWLH